MKKHRLIYDVAPELCTYRTTLSYAAGAEKPIMIAHYKHEFTNDPYTTPIKDRSWCSIFISLSENFSFILNNKMYSPARGDVVIMREHEKYSSYFRFTSPMDYFEINLPPEYFTLAAGTEAFSRMFYAREEGERNMISLGHDAFSHIMDELSCIETSAQERDLLRYACIVRILDIMSSACDSTAQPGTQDRIPATLRRAIIYIHEHFSEISGVHEVADACGISGIYLARIFKKHLGSTPGDYITILRIAYAKHLLASGEGLTDACFKSGFNSYTYFTSKFKNIVGITPSKFKKEQF